MKPDKDRPRMGQEAAERPASHAPGEQSGHPFGEGPSVGASAGLPPVGRRLRTAHWMLAAYGLMLAGVAVFFGRTFGWLFVAFWVWIPALPAIIVFRRLRRPLPVRWREQFYFGVLWTLAIVGAAGVVQKWYGLGLDGRHADEIRHRALERRLREDDRFRYVEVAIYRKGPAIYGAVATAEDLERLRSLCKECGIELSDDAVSYEGQPERSQAVTPPRPSREETPSGVDGAP